MSRRLRCEVLVVGSGFAGSLLARCLSARGRAVVLVERQRHPRFALGESTTPLGNLALERLARRFGWRDLWNLATWGRWRRHYPDLGCGLKRGFTFLDGGGLDARTVMVAASPRDEVADIHWLRSDVDAHLFAAAAREGVSTMQEAEVVDLDLGGDGAVAVCRTTEGLREVDAQFVVDASGGAAVVADAAGVGAGPPPPVASALLFAHVRGLPVLDGGPLDAPYRPQWSAVHHLLDFGWMYELRFDDGLASCGLVLDHDRCRVRGIDLGKASPVGERWQLLVDDLLTSAPDLRRRLREARPVTSLGWVDRIQRRRQRASGERFALLPQSFSFTDPMFSAGIAWSLVAVERLCDALEPARSSGQRSTLLEEYDRLLRAEADHLDQLLAGAYALFDDLDDFGWYSQVYFAAASFAETSQRILAPQEWPRSSARGPSSAPWHWRGFLGADDPVTVGMVREARRLTGQTRSARRLAVQVPSLIAPRNLAGLADGARHPRYPVRVETVRSSASLLGLDPEEVERRLPALLGEVPFDGPMAAGSRPVPPGSPLRPVDASQSRKSSR